MAPNGTDCATIADGARLECASVPQGPESLPNTSDVWAELTPEGTAADNRERPLTAFLFHALSLSCAILPANDTVSWLTE